MACFCFASFSCYFVFSIAAEGDSHNVKSKPRMLARQGGRDQGQQEADEDIAKATAELEQLKKAGAI